MKEITMLSWNVNGIRAMVKKEIYKGKDFCTWLEKDGPDFTDKASRLDKQRTRRSVHAANR